MAPVEPLPVGRATKSSCFASNEVRMLLWEYSIMSVEYFPKWLNSVCGLGAKYLEKAISFSMDA